MSQYIDGFVLPILKSNVDGYTAMATSASKIWLEHGALQYRECVSDGLEVPFGLPMMAPPELLADEVVVFAWITYASREDRDRVTAAVMEDPRIKALCGEDGSDMLFDPERMHCGVFKTIVAAG